MASEQKPNPQFIINRSDFKPAYLKLFKSGELQNRVEASLDALKECNICPRACNINRLENETRVCKTGRYARVSSYFPHFGEEDCLRGWAGSGTIFFSMCSLRCIFCQNYDISHYQEGRETNAEQLTSMMIKLQRLGCHNINFVTPEHVVPQIIEALPLAVEMGLRIPLIYNTSGYDSLESLRLMDGIVDIYMPDFKFWDEDCAKKYLKAKEYPEVARNAIKEMYRQVGALKFDENGIALRGLLIRHLVMPDCLDQSESIFRFLAEEISPYTFINIMDQYYPPGQVNEKKYSEINHRTSVREYEQAMQLAKAAGITRFDQRRFILSEV
jgi:putative pyruvate formate lyase activating enzyme